MASKPEEPWVTSDAAWAVGGVFTLLSVVMTCHQIYMHLKSWTNPHQQKWIVRILFMVPIYSIASWLSLHYYREAIYFDTIRNCYEAFVIYNFLSLCFEYLGGESAILAAVKGRTNKPSWWTCTCCLPEFMYNNHFLRFCKQATLQFCVVKPLMAAFTIVLVINGVYHEGSLNPREGYLYVAFIYNTSITLALFALVLFYTATRDFLAPHKPVMKFLVVKSVIFLSFWQAFFIAIVEVAGGIQATENIESGELANAYQNFLICIEMFLAAICHRYAFPWSAYRLRDGLEVKLTFKRIGSNLKTTLNPSDVIDDTIRNFTSKYSNYARQVDHDTLDPAQEAMQNEQEEEDTANMEVVAGKFSVRSRGERVPSSADDESPA